MNMSISSLQKQIPGNSRLAKLLSIICISSFVVSTIFIMLAYGPHSYFGLSTTALAWWGTGLVYLDWLIAIFISSLQSNAYGVYGVFSKISFKGKKVLLDERQIQVRRRIFEKSYVCLAVLVLIMFYALIFASSWFSRIESPSLYTIHHHIFVVEWLYWNLPLMVVTLPSLVAVWEKDS